MAKSKKHIETGKLGEELAVGFIIQNGFALLERNWRYKHCEVDIIASKEKTLHFFEVKTRRSNRYGYPEELVNRNKLYHFTGAGAAYIRRHRVFRWVRYDILSITLDQHDKPSFFLIEDVYF